MKLEWDFKELYKFAEKLTDDRLEQTFERITKDISKALLKRIKGFTPVQDYDLINAWDKNKFLVTETKNGYEVLLVNKIEYATWVNDGHRQTPGRFIPGYWEGTRFHYQPHTSPNYQGGGMVLKKSWVMGKFFVEKGIISLNNVAEIESLIMRELQKWWKGCF